MRKYKMKDSHTVNIVRQQKENKKQEVINKEIDKDNNLSNDPVFESLAIGHKERKRNISGTTMEKGVSVLDTLSQDNTIF